MSYHIESNHSFESLPERIFVREDGWLGALRFDDEPVVDYWYVPMETCKNVAPDYLDYLCSECGFVHYHSDENDSGDGNKWSYCPNCGRRIVE